MVDERSWCKISGEARAGDAARGIASPALAVSARNLSQMRVFSALDVYKEDGTIAIFVYRSKVNVFITRGTFFRSYD